MASLAELELLTGRPYNRGSYSLRNIGYGINCLNKLALDYFSSCIPKLSDRHTRELWNSATNLLIPRMKTSYGQKSFAFRGAKEWKNLDLRTKLAPSIQGFKSFLKESKVSSMV